LLHGRRKWGQPPFPTAAFTAQPVRQAWMEREGTRPGPYTALRMSPHPLHEISLAKRQWKGSPSGGVLQPAKRATEPGVRAPKHLGTPVGGDGPDPPEEGASAGVGAVYGASPPTGVPQLVRGPSPGSLRSPGATAPPPASRAIPLCECIRALILRVHSQSGNAHEADSSANRSGARLPGEDPSAPLCERIHTH
jgi:hypothetical protein